MHPPPRSFLILVLWLTAVCGGQPSGGQDAEPGGGGAAAAELSRAIPPGVEVYLGRRIAQTMHYSGASWLVRESREREEDTKQMLRRLKVEPGSTVCDVGCGNGFYALQMAGLVGKEGRVLGVDIQPEMLELLADRAEAAGITNVEPVLGSVVDPHLEPGSIDLALLVDVYHEFSHPEQMLGRLRGALAPGGRLVLVEFRAEDPDVPIKELHKMSKAQILREMSANGFRLAAEFDGLPWQHMMTFIADGDRTRGVGEALFDGRSLDGWEAMGGGRWSVEGGAIVGRSTSDEPAHGLLLSEGSYGDFMLAFEYRVLEGNSGLYFRSEPVEDAVGVHGFQVEVDDTSPGGLYETGGRGWVVEHTAEESDEWHESGGWNAVRLFALGEHVEVYVNGRQTAAIDDPQGRREGRLALQLHGGQDMHVEFRGLRVRRE